MYATFNVEINDVQNYTITVTAHRDNVKVWEILDENDKLINVDTDDESELSKAIRNRIDNNELNWIEEEPDWDDLND